MTHALALDQGTTSSRAVVLNQAGAVVGAAQRSFPQRYPRPGWVEHEPEELWSSQCDAAREALGAAGLSDADVGAVGVTNQRETTVLWDRATGAPVAPAIVWQDRRTASVCERLRDEGHEAMIATRTGLVLDAYFSATKVAWILDHTPGLRERAGRGEIAFGTVDSWLLWRLTGGAVHATDVSNASRTTLFDIHRCVWDDELLALFGVPRGVLPEVADSSGAVGRVAPGLPGAGAPIAGIAGDQQAALFGQRCTTAGSAKCTYGTGCFLLTHTGSSVHASSHRMLSTVAWRCADGRTEYALEGSVFVAGALIDWLRDGPGIVASGAECDALASTVGDAGGAVIVPAFVGLGAPRWDPHARASIQGLTRGTTKAHLCRAALDAIACSVVDVVRAMEADTGAPIEELRVDGGVAASDALLQIQADLLQRPVVRARDTETTALGAAYLAGLGAGLWTPGDVDEIDASGGAGERFEPRRSAASVAGDLGRWREAVGRSMGWAATAGAGEAG